MREAMFEAGFPTFVPQPSKVIRRGKRGKFATKPFKLITFEYVDWMNCPVEECFSLKSLVPRRLEAVNDGHSDEDFIDGYNHHPDNLKVNKTC